MKNNINAKKAEQRMKDGAFFKLAQIFWKSESFLPTRMAEANTVPIYEIYLTTIDFALSNPIQVTWSQAPQ